MRMPWPRRNSRWPSSMVLRIEDHDPFLLRLLFARELYGLKTQPGLPRVSIRGERAGLDPLERTRLSAKWEMSWAMALASFRDHDHEGPFRGLQNALRLRGEPFPLPPAAEADYRTWSRSLDLPARLPISPRDNRDKMPLLVQAWERGLRWFVVLPYEDPHAELLGRGTLHIDSTSFREPQALSEALELFRQ